MITLLGNLTVSDVFDICMLMILMLARILIVAWLIREMFKFQKGIIQRFRILKEKKIDTRKNVIKLIAYDAIVIMTFFIVIWFFMVV